MYEIESQVTDHETRQALVEVLKQRLAILQQREPDPESAGLTTKKSAEFAESGESALQPQQLPPESDLSPGSPNSPETESGAPTEQFDSPDTVKNFAAALEKLDPALREIASDLYEHMHHKSKFARLTSLQRDSILELLKSHIAEDVAKIIAQPPPIGMNFQTSKAGVNRFRDEYMRCAMDRRKAENARAADDDRRAFEESFKNASASENTFRQTTVDHVRKRLFKAVNNPDSDYHEIRWLIKSLNMLRAHET